MCKYKELTKPNHWRIVLFLENNKREKTSKQLTLRTERLQKKIKKMKSKATENLRRWL